MVVSLSIFLTTFFLFFTGSFDKAGRFALGGGLSNHLEVCQEKECPYVAVCPCCCQLVTAEQKEEHDKAFRQKVKTEVLPESDDEEEDPVSKLSSKNQKVLNEVRKARANTGHI